MGVVARTLADVLEVVTLPEYRVLVVLCAEGPLRSGVLAERLRIHQSTFTRLADRLVAQGWGRREANAESRRGGVVGPTDARRPPLTKGSGGPPREFRRIPRGAPA